MRLIKLLIAVAFCLILSVAAFAHPGGTDSNGGHYNRSTGEYHYHHGHSAHQHTDMDGDGVLDCPYNFKDKTGSSSGSSSSSKPTQEPTTQTEYPPYIPTLPTVKSDYYKGETTSTETSKSTFEQIWELVSYFGVLFCQIAGIMIGFLGIVKIADIVAIYMDRKSKK